MSPNVEHHSLLTDSVAKELLLNIRYGAKGGPLRHNFLEQLFFPRRAASTGPVYLYGSWVQGLVEASYGQWLTPFGCFGWGAGGWPWPRGPWAEPWPLEASEKASLIQPDKEGLNLKNRTVLTNRKPGGDRKEFVCVVYRILSVLYRIHYRIHYGSRSDPGLFYRFHPFTTCIIARRVVIFHSVPARPLALI